MHLLYQFYKAKSFRSMLFNDYFSFPKKYFYKRFYIPIEKLVTPGKLWDFSLNCYKYLKIPRSTLTPSGNRVNKVLNLLRLV